MKPTMLIPFLLLFGVACRDSTVLGPGRVGPLDSPAALSSGAGALIAATDFSEYPPGQQPSDWTRRWTAGGTVSWTVQRDSSGAFAGHSKLVMQVAAGQGATRALSWDAVGQRSHVRVHTRLRMASVSDKLVGLTVLGGGTAGKEDGYAWVVHRSSAFTGLRLWRVKGGQDETELRSHAMSLAKNTFYHLVLEKRGDTLRAKAWADGAAEPAWQVEAVDTLLRSGWAGFGNFSPGTVEFDFFRAYDPAVQRPPVPALPPDSTPRAVLEEISAEANRVYYDPEVHRLWYMRNVIRLYFKEDTPQEQRQTAVDMIDGEVIGGHRFTSSDGTLVMNGGLYLIRIQDAGTDTPLWNAINLLRTLPHVAIADAYYYNPVHVRYRKPKDEGD